MEYWSDGVMEYWLDLQKSGTIGLAHGRPDPAEVLSPLFSMQVEMAILSQHHSNTPLLHRSIAPSLGAYTLAFSPICPSL
jgi:hypothetical protein